MLKPKTLVVVADGTSAVLWQNHGHGVDLHEIERVTFGSMSDDGPAGSMPVEQSLRDLEEATFVKLLIRKLNDMMLNNQIEGDVVIIADPTSLGQMRPQYHAKLAERIVKELPKTLVKASKQELEKALT
jgi:protein required for attachment to host cells